MQKDRHNNVDLLMVKVCERLWVRIIIFLSFTPKVLENLEWKNRMRREDNKQKKSSKWCIQEIHVIKYAALICRFFSLKNHSNWSVYIFCYFITRFLKRLIATLLMHYYFLTSSVVGTISVFDRGGLASDSVKLGTLRNFKSIFWLLGLAVFLIHDFCSHVFLRTIL